MTFVEIAKQILSLSKEPLTSSEIWIKAVENGLDKKINSKGKTPWQSIKARLYIDIRDNPNSVFQQFSKNPAKFGIRGVNNIPSDNFKASVTFKKETKSFTERDLHPLLVKFVDSYYHFRGTKVKTIFHENSNKTNKGYNKWLHPDLVGVYFSFNDQIREYESVIITFQQDFSIIPIKLFSFELKVSLNLSNLRESYFQAVSNSSWANEGYLVALKINEEVIEEARRLSNSFGIGLIRLDAENIEQSEIIIPALTKKQLDIDTMDRLATENKDFSSFLQFIIDDNKVKKVRSPYDKVLSFEEFEQYLKLKGITN